MLRIARIPIVVGVCGWLGALSPVAFAQSTDSAGTQHTTQTHRVFGLDTRYVPVVDIDRTAQRSPAIDGILAMLAFQVTPSGCAGPRDEMDCPLTRELGLGMQCSEAHVAMVKRWFPDSMPKIGGYHEQRYAGYAGAGPEAGMCAQTPDSASVQDHLVAVDVRQDGDLVTIDSEVSWYAREESGALAYRSEFRIEQDKIVLVAHRKLDRSLSEYKQDGPQEKVGFVEFLRNLLRW